MTEFDAKKVLSNSTDTHAKEGYTFGVYFFKSHLTANDTKAEPDAGSSWDQRKRKEPSSAPLHTFQFRTYKRQRSVNRIWSIDTRKPQLNACETQKATGIESGNNSNRAASTSRQNILQSLASNYSHAQTQASRSVYTENEPHFNHAEKRYSLSHLWDTPQQIKSVFIKSYLQQQPHLGTLYRRNKTPHFETYWSCPVGALFAAASKRMLLKPSTLREALVVGLLSLRRNAILASYGLEGARERNMIDSCKETHHASSIVTRPAEKSILLQDEIDITGPDGNSLMATTTEMLGDTLNKCEQPYSRRRSYVSVDSKISTTAPLSGSSESIGSTAPLEGEDSKEATLTETRGTSLCSSIEDTSFKSKAPSRENQTLAEIVEEDNVEMPSAALHVASDSLHSGRSERCVGRGSPSTLSADTSSTMSTGEALYDLVARLDQKEMRELLLAFERSDPYATVCQHTSPQNRSGIDPALRPRTFNVAINRYALLARILALKRLGWLMEFHEYWCGLDSQTSMDDQLQDKSTDDEGGWMRLTLTESQLKLLKLPLHSIIGRLHCQRVVRTPPSSPPSGYETRRTQGRCRRRIPEHATAAVRESRPALCRRTVSHEASRTEPRSRQLTARGNTRSYYLKSQQSDHRKSTTQSSPQTEGATPSSQQSGHYYSRRAGRPKVNRAGCRCLLCHTLQTPQWRFMPLFGDNWMDLVCNACYMKFNGSRPHYFRVGKTPPFPQVASIEKPRRPSAEEYRAKGPCAFPHLMRRNDSKQLSLIASREPSPQPDQPEETSATVPTAGIWANASPKSSATNSSQAEKETRETVAVVSLPKVPLAEPSTTVNSLNASPTQKREIASQRVSPEPKRRRSGDIASTSSATDTSCSPPRVALRSAPGIARHEVTCCVPPSDSTASSPSLPFFPTSPSNYYYYYCAATASAAAGSSSYAGHRPLRPLNSPSPAAALQSPLCNYYFPDYNAGHGITDSNLGASPLLLGHPEGSSTFLFQESGNAVAAAAAAAFNDAAFQLALRQGAALRSTRPIRSAYSLSWPLTERPSSVVIGYTATNPVQTEEVSHNAHGVSGAITWGVPCATPSAAAVQRGAPVQLDASQCNEDAAVVPSSNPQMP